MSLKSHIVLLLGLAFQVTLPKTVAAQTAHIAAAQQDLRGIYIYTNDVSQVSKPTAAQLTQAFGIPGVDGVAVVIGWNAIEPSRGQYQWTVLDQWIGQVAALGLKIDLVVPAGSSTPGWLFQPLPTGAGAKLWSFTVSPHAGETGVCDAVNIAAPWDPIFLAEWDAMLAALSAHLKSAGTYNSITLVRLTGINRTTEELRLPSETAASTGLSCVGNSIATWQQAGYRPSLLLQAWNAIFGSFLKSFPDKRFAVSIIPNNAFPGIDQNGAAISGAIGDENDQLVSSAAQQLPGRLVVQFDFLMPGEAAASQVVNDASTFGTLVAFQTNEYMGPQGAGCSEPITATIPCTNSTYLVMLDEGIYPNTQSNPLRAQYIEVFHANATAFPGDILTAHLQLLPPAIDLVANAEGEIPAIAPNTWVEIKGSGLSLAEDTRTWQSSDFVNGQMPTNLDGVNVTVNGKAAYVYYISPSQINILTPPDPLPAAPQVAVTNHGVTASATASAVAISPSFFVLSDGLHLAAVHTDGSLIGPTSFSVPGYTFRPAQPGETVLLFANGFGPTSAPIVSGSSTQSGALTPLPSITIGGVAATVGFAGLTSPGLFQFNVTIPNNVPGGDEPVVATYEGVSTQSGTLLTLTGTAPPTSVTFYVSPSGKDSWSGTLAAPNSAGTDGPFATFEHARAAVATVNKTGLAQIHVQFRGGAYYLPATEMMTAADSGAPTLAITYENYPGESPVFSGGVRIQNWTNAGGSTWKATLLPSTQYFENLFYNGARRLRPRLGGALGTYFRYIGPVYLQGAAPPANPPDSNCSEYFAGSGWECFDRFQYAPTDPISASWKNLAPAAGNHCNQPAGNANLGGDIELVNFEQYSVSKLRLSCVDPASHIVYLTGVTATEADHLTSHGFIPNHRYLIENVEDSLALPGQWFLDRSSTPWTLTYLANPGENPTIDSVVAPQLTQLVVASALQYVTFRGLTFEHDNYTIPATGYNGDSEIISAISFQNSQHITVDSVTVAQTSGTGLEFISCIDHNSPKWCVAYNTAGLSANNVIQNSAFYDLAAGGIRVGVAGNATDTNSNVPQFHTVQNTVVEGFGRVYASSKGIDQGQGHDNLYTHNEVYDGYKGAIKVCYCANSDVNPPFTNNNVVAFNHVHDLFQGIMNDSGSIYFGVGTPSPPQSGTGNKMLNNKVHDVNDASVMDADGYGGDGLYADDFSGQVDMENNLVYRVSGNAISFSGPRAGLGQSSTVKNNILAFARQSMLNAYDPYSFGTNPPLPMFFTASSNIFYFDRAAGDSFFVQGGCTYAGEAYTNYEVWSSNVFWRTDQTFATDAKAFHTQQSRNAANLCGNKGTWTNYTFAGWQASGEDVQSVIQNPGFNNPAYPADDFSLPKGSPGFGFFVFDSNQAGRTNPVLKPPAVAATFPTKLFNPATDF